MFKVYYYTQKEKHPCISLCKGLINFTCCFIPSKGLRDNTRERLKKHCAPIFGYFAVQKYQDYTDYTYNLSIIACLKNESLYVCEWIEYYRLMGVQHFYLYNNNSTDNIHDVLAPYIEEGIVTLTDYPGLGKQHEIYNYALNKHRLTSKWFAIVDLDEFILPKSHKNITAYIEANSQYSQIHTTWHMFGDSGHKRKPEGLVIENFLHRGTPSPPYKSIVRSSDVYCIKVHRHKVIKKAKIAPIEEIQCNHYFTKSEEEYFTKKAPRKSASKGLDAYTRSAFDAANRNEIFDDSMLQYVDTIKAALAAKNRL